MLQGVCSPFMLTTPTIGLAIAASSSPIARMKARCGARSRPPVVTRDRHFFMLKYLWLWSECETPRGVRLLQWRHDSWMLELRDIELRQHPGLGINGEHLLDRRKIRRGARIPTKVVVFQQICLQHRDRRLQHFIHDF